MSDRNDRQIFIPLCNEKAHLQRERARGIDQGLTQADEEFLRVLKVKP
jgi:hypothetical protein